MQIKLLSFSNVDLNLDLLSKISAINIIIVSSIFEVSISWIIFSILSLTLLIIISLLSPKEI